MNYLDIVLAVLLAYGAIRGFLKGAILSIASLVAFVVGLYGSIHFSTYMADWLVNYVAWQPDNLELIAFVLTFIVIVIVIILIGKLLTKTAETLALGLLNKMLGAIVGLLKMILISGAILLVLSTTNHLLRIFSKDVIENSVLYKPVKGTASILFEQILKNSNTQIELEEN